MSAVQTDNASTRLRGHEGPKITRRMYAACKDHKQIATDLRQTSIKLELRSTIQLKLLPLLAGDLMPH